LFPKARSLFVNWLQKIILVLMPNISYFIDKSFVLSFAPFPTLHVGHSEARNPIHIISAAGSLMIRRANQYLVVIFYWVTRNHNISKVVVEYGSNDICTSETSIVLWQNNIIIFAVTFMWNERFNTPPWPRPCRDHLYYCHIYILWKHSCYI